MKRGRLHAPELDVLIARPTAERPTLELRAPSPGTFVPSIGPGALVSPGGAIGDLVVLGRTATLIVPRGADATGIAQKLPPATHPVGYGDLLVALDPSLALGTLAPGASHAARSPGASDASRGATVDGLVFCAPTSGRFYGRPAPDKPPFVTEGAQLTTGTTICLLEVMKTFHRVHYGGPGLPETARVRRVLVAEGADVSAGDPLLALE
ncbi:MAG TPA: biotin/lipoyl-containing protein [Kofleriaceae bacterium]|nr:biotin/lipoyl-containing protein [Kofleriaceae bacterium]